MKYSSVPLWEIKLDDKYEIIIRPITPEDIELEKDFFNQLSQESKHNRFLGGVAVLSSKVLADLCNIDHLHDMAFVAISKDGLSKKIVGVVRYAEDQVGNKKAEIAVTVADDWQDKGIGTELLKKLIEFAQVAGIKKFYSIDNYANEKMRVLAKEFGFSKHQDPEDASLIIYDLDI